MYRTGEMAFTDDIPGRILKTLKEGAVGVACQAAVFDVLGMNCPGLYPKGRGAEGHKDQGRGVATSHLSITSVPPNQEGVNT